MLLAFDIGNTNLVAGLFDGSQLAASWRMQADRRHLAEDWSELVLGLMRQHNFQPQAIRAVAIASVVPPITPAIVAMCQNYLHLAPFIVQPGIKTGLNLHYDNPAQLGADRLVNAVAAFQLYGGPAIVVDMGTATKFEVITAQGDYLGGAIAPGIKVAADSLFQNASRLAQVELIPPDHAIGRNNAASLQAGLVYGYVGLVEGMVRRIKAEMPPSQQPVKVIATGGLANLIAKDSAGLLDIIEPHLTLRGLQLLYQLNQPNSPA